MWQEARRQEKKIRGMLVDYRKRADRRREYYEKIKLDPSQFLQIHGRKCKIHLDQNIPAAIENSSLVPWKDQNDNLIDRFDVRAHLDYIPVIEKADDEESSQEERLLNYERYRIIAQNSFLGIPEEKCLRQLNLEEQFGYTDTKQKKAGAAIGYSYENTTEIQDETSFPEEIDDEDSDSDFDVDLAINISKIDPIQANEMNKHACCFGMSSNDFYSFLINDMEEAEALKLAKEEEQGKAFYSGRKSRKERRLYREKFLSTRTITSPSYAAKDSSQRNYLNELRLISRSPSPDNNGKITFITSFGGEEEEPSTSNGIGTTKKSEKLVDDSRGSRHRKHSLIRNKPKYVRSRSSSGYKRRESNRRSYVSRHRKYRYRRNRSSSNSSRSSRSYSRSHTTSESQKNERRFNQKSNTADSSEKPISPRTDVINSNNFERSISSGEHRVSRYYGRRKDKNSSDITTDDENNDNSYSRPTNKKTTNSTIIERLKRKRQALLTRQYRADKKAAQLKTEKKKIEEQMREDELREIAMKLRRKARQKRNLDDSLNSYSSDSSYSSDESPTDSYRRNKYYVEKKRDKFEDRARYNERGGENETSASRSKINKEFTKDECTSRNNGKLVDY